MVGEPFGLPTHLLDVPSKLGTQLCPCAGCRHREEWGNAMTASIRVVSAFPAVLVLLALAGPGHAACLDDDRVAELCRGLSDDARYRHPA